jgi:undecaprenyl-diphosphatase
LNFVDAILLGIIQGLTEFLPISSTAHLTLAGKLLGIVRPEHYSAWTSFVAVTQLGTLGAVVVYFSREFAQMSSALVNDLKSGGITFRRDRMSDQGWIGMLIIVGTIPIGLAGLFFSEVIRGFLTKNLIVIGISLIALALLLWLAERMARHTRDMHSLTFKEAIFIGIGQALALIPGSSRSGTTLTAGLFLGLTRQAAARFSFLLSVPAVLASGIHEMTSLEASPFAFGMPQVLVATVVAGLSGYAAIAWLLRYLMKKTTMVFIWYRIALGLVLLALVFLGMVDP